MVRLSSPIECIHKSSLAHTIFQLHTKSTCLAAMSKPEPFQETTYLALFPKYHADIKCFILPILPSKVCMANFNSITFNWKGHQWNSIKRVVVLFKRLLNFKPTETNFKALKALKREPARDFGKTKVFQVALETFELEKFANI